MRSHGQAACGLLLALVALVARPCSALQLATMEMSWRSCRSLEGASDPRFPQLCATDMRNPLHVAVSLHATFIPTGPAGAVAADYVSGGGGSVFLPGGVGGEARSIGWQAPGGEQTFLPYSEMGGRQGYLFAVLADRPTSYGDMGSFTGYSTRLSFSVMLPESGEYEAFFKGCCRWHELLNTMPADYSKPASWNVVSHIKVSATSMALSFSPVVLPPVAQVQLQAMGRTTKAFPRSLLLTGLGGGALHSLVNDTDVAGRYTEYASTMRIDSSLAVRQGGSMRAYLREDGRFSILWFECPPGGELQLQWTRAYARQPGWVVVKGDVRALVGQAPLGDTGLPLLESIGGVWPEGAAYDAWRMLGPSFLRGAVRLEHDMSGGSVLYANSVEVAAYLPEDPLLPPYVAKGTYGASLKFALAPLTSDNFVLPGALVIDEASGVIAFENRAVYELCLAARARHTAGRLLEMCAFAVPVVVSVDAPGGGVVSSMVDMRVEVSTTSDVAGQWREPPIRTYALEGVANVVGATSPQAPLTVACGTTQTTKLAFKVDGRPQFAGSGVWGASTTWSFSYLFHSADFPAATFTTGQGATAFTYWVSMSATPACGVAAQRGLKSVCLDVAFASVANFTTRRAPAGQEACFYWEVTDASATTPPAAVATTPAPATPPPPPPARVVLPTPAPAGGAGSAVHALDAASVLPDARAQIAAGFLDLQFVEDYALMPNTVYRSHFSVGHADCLCAGARDLQLQRSLIERWNTDSNTLDSATKGLFYNLGSELQGATATLASHTYTWSCLRPRRLYVTKAETFDTEDAARAYSCMQCWRDQDATCQ